MANQSAPGGWSKILEGVKHFLKRVKKDLGGFNPPSPPLRKPAHDTVPRATKRICGVRGKIISGAKLYLWPYDFIVFEQQD